MKTPILIITAFIVSLAIACNNNPKTNKDESRTDSVKVEESNKTTNNEKPVEKNKKQTPDALSVDDLKNAIFFGTEPNWTLKFTEDYAEYIPMEGQTTKMYYKKNYGDRTKNKLSDVIVVVSETTLEVQANADSGGGINLTVKKEACSDGMSDNTYPYSLSIMIDEVGEQKGCGRVKK